MNLLPPTNDNAPGQGREVGTANSVEPHDSTPSIPRCAANPREDRLLSILMERGQTSRHDLDRLIGAENTPDVVMRIRRKLHLDIDMEKKPFVDRDGKTVRIGYYSLSERDREALQWRAA